MIPNTLWQALGDSYKWLLYGDDDTVFFPAAALQLLASFDPDLPYAITDNLWFEEALVAQPPFRHPALDAPRCLPCHFVDDPLALRTFTGGSLNSVSAGDYSVFDKCGACLPSEPFNFWNLAQCVQATVHILSNHPSTWQLNLPCTAGWIFLARKRICFSQRASSPPLFPFAVFHPPGLPATLDVMWLPVHTSAAAYRLLWLSISLPQLMNHCCAWRLQDSIRQGRRSSLRPGTLQRPAAARARLRCCARLRPSGRSTASPRAAAPIRRRRRPPPMPSTAVQVRYLSIRSRTGHMCVNVLIQLDLRGAGAILTIL